MCGILGYIGAKSSSHKNLLNSLKHRGPDNQSSFYKEKIFLGHTRLAIQDLSENGNQPMFSNDGRFVIVFNGEIYNHVEIRETLYTKYDFISNCDTETVLYTYIEYGSKCLDYFNGIFAFAVYDTMLQTIFIARDHFGVKPLYYYKNKDNFIFASELKSILEFDISTELDLEALVNYLTFLYSPGVKTPFKNVQKLLPGNFISFSINDFHNANPENYYLSQYNGQYHNKTEEELIDELEQYLIASVKRQMLSDVPVGFFLSGGLDSTLLVAIARKIYPERKFHCFTLNDLSYNLNNDGFISDIDYARKAANFLKVELHEVKSDCDILANFDKMIWHLDEPQADPAPVHVLNISSLARDFGIKVLIGGTAGDDIFSGYRRHQAIFYEKYFNIFPKSLRKLFKRFVQSIKSNSVFIRRLKKLTENFDLDSEERMKGYFKWIDLLSVKSLFVTNYSNALKTYDPTSIFDNYSIEIPMEKNLLNKMLYWELKTFLVDHNLNYTDKMAMAVGVEVRVPYLDKELVEFSQKIPPAFKIKGNTTKYILKKVAERYLPKDIIYRPKTGFGSPVRSWVKNELSNFISTRLSVEVLEKRGIFNAEEVLSLIERNKKGEIDASYTIWALLAIESWMLQFVDRKNLFPKD
jgi:asparagine synthase (glutamine-hydrolysing)